MLGAHLDSWHGGTGATDNGAGSVVAMEAMRILKAVERQAAPDDPHRPLDRRGAGALRLARLRGPALRLAASAHAGGAGQALVPAEGEGAADDQARAREARGVLQPGQRHRQDPRDLLRGERRGHSHLRGVARALPRSGRDDRDHEPTGGTDHESFDGVGLPGFQFIQDELEYETRTHHTNMDLYERLVKDDLDAGLGRDGGRSPTTPRCATPCCRARPCPRTPRPERRRTRRLPRRRRRSDGYRPGSDLLA